MNVRNIEYLHLNIAKSLIIHGNAIDKLEEKLGRFISKDESDEFPHTLPPEEYSQSAKDLYGFNYHIQKSTHRIQELLKRLGT